MPPCRRQGEEEEEEKIGSGTGREDGAEDGAPKTVTPMARLARDIECLGELLVLDVE